jgi:hypothetical protein
MRKVLLLAVVKPMKHLRLLVAFGIILGLVAAMGLVALAHAQNEDQGSILFTLSAT